MRIMTGYTSLLPEHNDVADGEAVPGVILRVVDVKSGIDVIESLAAICSGRQRAGID